jgi:GntR family transcriptional regulator
MASPLYRLIADDLRQQIASGKLLPGDQLSTELELRERYNASRNTVRDAIKVLMNLGLVETRPGQGTFVVQATDPFVTTLTGDATTGVGGDEGASYRAEVEAQHRNPDTSPVQVEIQRAVPDVAIRLAIPAGTEVISRHERRFIDGTPWSMQTSFYPMAFADRGASRLRSAGSIEQGTVQYLAETLGLKQVGYRDLITLRTASGAEADFFRIPPDGRISMYEVFRTAFDGSGTPMRLTVTVFPADRNQFIVDNGLVPETRRLPDEQPEVSEPGNSE